MQENLRNDFWKGDITAFKEIQDNSIVKYWQDYWTIVSHCKTIENLR